jgi:phosphoglucosamine mutase
MYILAYANPNRSGPWSGIVGTSMSNQGFEDGIKKLGYKFKRAEVGDKHVSLMLQKKGWLLGGEPSGHIICRDLVSTGDGTIAALKVISSLLLLEKDPADILRNYSKMPQIMLNIDVTNTDILSDVSVQKAIKEVESDLTVGRVLVRPSGTEPKIIRVMVESEDEATAKKYAQDIAKMLHK